MARKLPNLTSSQKQSPLFMINTLIKRTSKWELFLENVKIPGVTSFYHVIPRSTTAKKKKIVET